MNNLLKTIYKPGTDTKVTSVKDHRTVLEISNLSHWYYQGGQRIDVLNNASMKLKKGETLALVGPSGSGKSTLLHLAGMLEKPNDGKIEILGKDVSHLSETKQTKLRLNKIGFIYQSHNLLPDFTAVENVMIPQLIAGKSKLQARMRAEKLLMQMGLESRVEHRPSEMSGGEQQRVAIARALANEPEILLADEPTGNLDPNTSEKVFAELVSIIKETKLSALIVTHDLNLARKMSTTVRLRNGKLI